MWPSLATELAEHLAHELALAPLDLPPDLATGRGHWKNELATIETRAWEGERVALLRVARVEGAGLAIGNLLCVARPALTGGGRALPILGADLVAIAARDSIVVADLSPTEPHASSGEPLATALAADEEVGRLPRIAELPPWARETFSPAALAVRVSAGQESTAAAAVRRATDAFAALVRDARAGESADARARAVRHSQRRYMERHRTEDGGLTLLARIFGNEWSRRYIRELLFPELPESS